ncbi:MAG: glycosyltransferase [Acidobacteria bacterium]|nr:MAG: glycosyltransferase [Acidobacteriota bacterium]
MDLLQRILFAAAVLFAAVFLTRWVPRHPRWRLVVILLNVAISLRYLWWRATETINWSGGAGTVLSTTIFAAEIYGFLIVLHHYLIATRRLDRRSEPPDDRFMPSVDVFIATYDEEPDILYRTIVGCLDLDYPRKSVYVLDDGNRPEVEELCRRLGAGYIAREKNVGAKAGNLNHALSQTAGELIATFDADHVPVRTFLRETVGFFRDPKVAQVQTPHHFYNPDLFQDRLRIREYIANEQDMFYHVVQPGRDVYNSSFYCGSSAVLRRSALEEIGGFPTSTVTEDIHTTLLLHSKGYRSVFLDKDLAAGLAPESYPAYLTQRKRWARGTFQVMLTQKGLLAPRLTLMQRINYLATLWYWLYGFPRVVYLLAPVFFLLAGVRPLVVRNLGDLLSYYLPHLAISVAGFQLVNRGMRRIFWSDVYESCISVQVALAAISFPFTFRRRVRFEVTPKGRAADRPEVRRVGIPLALMSAAVAVAFVTGIVRLILGGRDEGGLLINTTWAGYNLIVLAMGLLLLRHRIQERSAIRVARRIPLELRWDGGGLEAVTRDVSETGLSFVLDEVRPLPHSAEVTLTASDGRSVTLGARLVRCDIGPDGRLSVGVEFVDRTEEQHRRLVQVLFGDPDAWSGPHAPVFGAPEHLLRFVRSMVAVFSPRRALRRLAPRLRGELPARVEIPGGALYDATTVDLSLEGAALRLSERGDGVSDRFRLTILWNAVERTTVDAEVRSRRRGGSGEAVLGVRFVDLAPEQRADLVKHLFGAAPEAVPWAAVS